MARALDPERGRRALVGEEPHAVLMPAEQHRVAAARLQDPVELPDLAGLQVLDGVAREELCERLAAPVGRRRQPDRLGQRVHVGRLHPGLPVEQQREGGRQELVVGLAEREPWRHRTCAHGLDGLLRRAGRPVVLRREDEIAGVDDGGVPPAAALDVPEEQRGDHRGRAARVTALREAGELGRAGEPRRRSTAPATPFPAVRCRSSTVRCSGVSAAPGPCSPRPFDATAAIAACSGSAFGTRRSSPQPAAAVNAPLASFRA